jgi:hypothetical protein
MMSAFPKRVEPFSASSSDDTPSYWEKRAKQYTHRNGHLSRPRVRKRRRNVDPAILLLPFLTSRNGLLTGIFSGSLHPRLPSPWSARGFCCRSIWPFSSWTTGRIVNLGSPVPPVFLGLRVLAATVFPAPQLTRISHQQNKSPEAGLKKRKCGFKKSRFFDVSYFEQIADRGFRRRPDSGVFLAQMSKTSEAETQQRRAI